jgi:hypothetical protein
MRRHPESPCRGPRAARRFALPPARMVIVSPNTKVNRPFTNPGNPRQMRVFAIRVRPAAACRSDSIHRDT